ncbi:hypothetical protein Mal4_19810 [Maioricimonas rarisocia]|uniref:Uncharacterized protein n=1 Tax=Maioricimonas rarisocia TaxID=2528026 RepID=A0A517Z5B7_9PLAN|nr:hypothetical protein [Maioricimonas rarisocia]QDU37665.1 hypothetical protein Mal4_19810 [Maioricimonas rarisocia]
MTKPARMDELLDAFYNGEEEEIDVEYIGRYRLNGRMVLRVPSPDIEASWAESVVPVEYLPLYGLKCGEPQLAGGLFEAAPFPRYDRSAPEYEWMNPPEAPEPVYHLCTDNCGAQFWVGDSHIVYGHNLDNEVQPIGPLMALVDYAIDSAMESRSWYERINEPDTMEKYGLQPINAMG